MHFVELVLYAWIPVVLFLFAALQPRHAVIAAYVAGWLFLPSFGIDLPGLPPFTKVSATAYGALLGALLFDTDRVAAFRPRWFDAPMALWCVAPFFASVTNGLGAYDGLSATLAEIVLWGIPYFMGRIYFNDWVGIRELAIGVFVGGLVYVPLCLIEMRVSPQFHKLFYGYHQHSFSQTLRAGGWRPMVFMQHGIACAMWMTTCGIVGVWLWTSGTLKRLFGVPMYLLAPSVVITAALCKSAGALVLLVIGLGIFAWVRWGKTAWPLVALILFIPAYVGLRASGQWSGQNLVSAAQSVFGEDRAKSLQYRLDAENLLTERALQKPMFGWGRWNRNRVYDEKGKDLAATDGLWVIVLGQTGFTGLTAITLAILMPALLYWWRCPAKWWMHPVAAAGAAFSVLLPLHMVDNLWNAMLNPIYVLVIGALMSLGASVRRASAQPQAQAFPVPQPMVPRPAMAMAR